MKMTPGRSGAGGAGATEHTADLERRGAVRSDLERRCTVCLPPKVPPNARLRESRTVPPMDITDELVTLRRYTRAEVATLLGIYETWLKKWVTANCIPHQRSGRTRGVWFTYDDVLAIGQLLPSLMTGTQANARAEGRTAVLGQDDEVRDLPIDRTHPATLDDVADVFGGLRSLRAR